MRITHWQVSSNTTTCNKSEILLEGWITISWKYTQIITELQKKWQLDTKDYRQLWKQCRERWSRRNQDKHIVESMDLDKGTRWLADRQHILVLTPQYLTPGKCKATRALHFIIWQQEKAFTLSFDVMWSQVSSQLASQLKLKELSQ